jgi:predicted RNA-binding Zn-ribbon protein involved in translation (DUF1610 family)
MEDEMTVGIIKLCKCKKQNLCLDENKISEPCPVCGRVYRCYHKGYTLKAKEINRISRVLNILLNLMLCGG